MSYNNNKSNPNNILSKNLKKTLFCILPFIFFNFKPNISISINKKTKKLKIPKKKSSTHKTKKSKNFP